jgi:apolipoprotein N-acyltransferase
MLHPQLKRSSLKRSGKKILLVLSMKVPTLQPKPLSLQSGQSPSRWPWAIVLMAGVLMGLTPAPVNAWGLAWTALAPLWVLVRQAKGRRPIAEGRIAALYGLIWGIGYHGCALFWITGIHPMTWMGVPWLASLAIAGFCWIFITLWGAVLVGLWAGVFYRLCHGWQNPQSSNPKDPKLVLSKIQTFRSKSLAPVWLSVLLGTALWCALEALWSAGPLWWSSLSYTQSPYNLVILHLGQFSGPAVVTAAIVAVNGLLAEAWMAFRLGHTRYAQALLAFNLGLLLILHLLGYALYNRPLAEQPAAGIKVGIIQGNIPNAIKLYEAGWRRAIEGYTTGYQTLAAQGVDVVLTPETALPTLWSGAARQSTTFYQAVLEEGVPVWLGAFGREGQSLTNSLFMVAGNGETLGEYRKVKLVPLGEYIPFESIIGRLINRLSPLEAHLLAGPPNQIFDTPLGRAIVGICYESAFASHFRHQATAGGEFIITASNDAHYSPVMPAQHHALDVMRAIETDRWAARATNTGYSAIVDPHGNTQWISGINTYELHTATLYRHSTQTAYVRWGDWFTPILIGITAIAVLLYYNRSAV